MTAFFAIIKLTCRSAIRSNVFRTLLVFLILAVLLVPNTIKGDGTAYGYIQVILEYSMGIVAFILFLSSIWLSCSEFSSDVESGQLHMIAVKPVSRITVFLGKFCGVLLIHTVLLVAASGAVYGFLVYQYKNQKFTAEERVRVENEVFTGRRVFMPYIPDMQEIATNEIKRLQDEAHSRGEKLPDMDSRQQEKFIEDVIKQQLASMGEVKYGMMRAWEYRGLPESYDGPVYLRYKAFSGSATTKNQALSYGFWGARLVHEKYENDDPSKALIDVIYSEGNLPPEEILCGATNEFELPGREIIYKGTAVLYFANMAPDGKTMYFQQADGPKLMIKKTSFVENFIRAVCITFLGVVAFTGLASATGALFTMPTAVFITISYIVVGMLSKYLLGTFANLSGAGVAPEAFLEKIGYYASSFMIKVLIPMQDFFISGRLADGELIEFSFMGILILNYLILRGLPLFALGATMYRRKELGIAMKR